MDNEGNKPDVDTGDLDSILADEDIFGSGVAKSPFAVPSYDGGEVKDFSNLIIDDDFKLILDNLENNNDHMFITGAAGAGKSTLLDYFISTTNKNVAVVAPTGIAALNIGGQTIHSFFKLRPGPNNNMRFNHEVASILGKLDVLIIDEISMVRSDFMDTIDMVMRTNTNNYDQPFGGIKLAMVGDLNQLPPVVATPSEREYIKRHYKSRYFFHANVFDTITIKKYMLKKVYRQKDKNFIKFLNRLKADKLNDKMISWFNKACYHGGRADEDVIYLCTTNASADLKNQKGIGQLPGKPRTYTPIINGDFNVNSTRFKAELTLKEGAKVMMINNDRQRRWFNGTMATVKELHQSYIDVEIDGSIYEVERVTYEKKKYEYKDERIDTKVVGSIEVHPLVPAWGITIHKSQGCTFHNVNIDLGQGSFDHGQTYVALSRASNMAGLRMMRPLFRSDLIVDPIVREFLTGFEND